MVFSHGSRTWTLENSETFESWNLAILHLENFELLDSEALKPSSFELLKVILELLNFDTLEFGILET